MKFRKIAIAGFVIVLLLFFALKPEYLDLTYLYRCIVWGNSDIDDYKRFTSHPIQNGSSVFYFQKDLEKERIFASKFRTIQYTYQGRTITDPLENLLQSTETTAFIVIQDDVLLYENYFNGYNRDSINTSFSMAKSFDSALIGIAIDEGYIKSVDEPITNYIPELRNKGFQNVTIRDLLTMTSGIKYKEGLLLWGDDTKTYYATNLRSMALNEVTMKEEPGKFFWYNNFNPILIGMILERATHKSVSQYLEEKIWKPLGMEFPASWSTDSKEHDFEKMESGINARAIDFAKFGRLFLHKGNWEGKQIISEHWVVESTRPNQVENPEYYKYYDNDPLKIFFRAENGYYKYFWWGYRRNDTNYDFFAMGKYGQFIYVSPEKNLIIVRNGKDWGKVDSWQKIFFDIAAKL
jgi:hypothetical protein